MKDFLELALAETDEILQTLQRIVELESFSSDKASLDALAAYITERLEESGARVEVVRQADAGDHLLAEIGEGPDQQLILGHMDTVWPGGTIQQRPFRVGSGLAYGPGVID